MSAAHNRFGYLAQTPTEQPITTPSPPPASLEAKKKKEQFNIRISVDVKRLAMSQAALEGRHISDVIEELLIGWTNEVR
jgi:hypothetical protein